MRKLTRKESLDRLARINCRLFGMITEPKDISKLTLGEVSIMMNCWKALNKITTS